MGRAPCSKNSQSQRSEKVIRSHTAAGDGHVCDIIFGAGRSRVTFLVARCSVFSKSKVDPRRASDQITPVQGSCIHRQITTQAITTHTLASSPRPRAWSLKRYCQRSKPGARTRPPFPFSTHGRDLGSPPTPLIRTSNGQRDAKARTIGRYTAGHRTIATYHHRPRISDSIRSGGADPS